MQIQLNAPKIWVASEPVDFRKAANGLSALVVTQFGRSLDDALYIFYNRAQNTLKLLAEHRYGIILIYKRMNKKRFTLKKNEAGYYEITEKELTWLLAGLDWVAMSGCHDLRYDDYF